MFIIYNIYIYIIYNINVYDSCNLNKNIYKIFKISLINIYKYFVNIVCCLGKNTFSDYFQMPDDTFERSGKKSIYIIIYNIIRLNYII